MLPLALPGVELRNKRRILQCSEAYTQGDKVYNHYHTIIVQLYRACSASVKTLEKWIRLVALCYCAENSRGRLCVLIGEKTFAREEGLNIFEQYSLKESFTLTWIVKDFLPMKSFMNSFTPLHIYVSRTIIDSEVITSV